MTIEKFITVYQAIDEHQSHSPLFSSREHAEEYAQVFEFLNYHIFKYHVFF